MLTEVIRASDSLGSVGPIRSRAHRPSVVSARRRTLSRFVVAGLELLERGYGALAILMLSGAVVPLVLQETVSSSELQDGHPLIRSLFAGIYLAMMFFIVLRWRSFLRVSGRELAMWLIVALAFASVLWAPEQAVTLRRALALLLTTSFGWYLAARYEMLSLLRLLAYSLGLLLALSLVYVIFLPELGIHTGLHEGAWRGAFVHKNLLGKLSAMAAMLFALLWKSEAGAARLPATLGFVVSLLMVAMSQSASATVTVVVMLVIMPILGLVRWRFSRAAPFLFGAVFVAGIAALLLTANIEGALLAMGRDSTLTGRTQLWAALTTAGMAHPWLGAGYGAFWAADNPQVELVQEVAGWRAYGSHNGLFDLWLDLGFVGISIFAVIVILAMLRSFRLLRLNIRPETALPLLIISFVVLTSLTEGGLIRQNNLNWAIFVAGVAAAFHARGGPRPKKGRADG